MYYQDVPEPFLVVVITAKNNLQTLNNLLLIYSNLFNKNNCHNFNEISIILIAKIGNLL